MSHGDVMTRLNINKNSAFETVKRLVDRLSLLLSMYACHVTFHDVPWGNITTSNDMTAESFKPAESSLMTGSPSLLPVGEMSPKDPVHVSWIRTMQLEALGLCKEATVYAWD